MALTRTTILCSMLLHGSLIAAALVCSDAVVARKRLVPPRVEIEVGPARASPPNAPPVPETEVVVEPLELHSEVADELPSHTQFVDVSATTPPQHDRRPVDMPPPAARELLRSLRHPEPTAAPEPAVTRVLSPIPGTDRPPEYPTLARRRGLEGTVVLLVTCDAAGFVMAIEVQRSSGHEALDAAAIAAVRTWRFGGGPGTCEQPVTFRLRHAP